MANSESFVVGLSLADLTAGTRVDVGSLVRTAQRAEQRSLDFLVIDDSYGGLRPTTLDPIAVASFLGASTRRIGLVATVQPLYLEPFDVAEALATSDFDSHGRTGWLPLRPIAADHAGLFDRPITTDPAEIDSEIIEFVDVVTRLFDGWEDGAVIRDISTGRYLDASKLHRIDHRGPSIRVRGPLVTPRSPQGRVPTFLRTTGERAAADSLLADVLIVDAAHADTIDSPGVPTFVEIETDPGTPITEVVAYWRSHAGITGILFTPGSPAATEAVLNHDWHAHSGAPAHPATLRSLLGLDRPANIYAAQTLQGAGQ
ncbi:LLM class flavin-dependent oxidoreductase [Mycobacterium sp. BMJ-28]